MIKIDKINRQVIITPDTAMFSVNAVDNGTKVIKEFSKLNKVFLKGTEDIYECELVLLDVPVYNDKHEETGQMETKAFARRLGAGFENWLEEFNEVDFIV